MDDTKHEILIPFDSIVDLVLLFEGSSKRAIELQQASLGGQDRQVFYPIKARTLTKFGGGVSADGRPILTLGINDTLELDLAITFGFIGKSGYCLLFVPAERRVSPRYRS